MVIPKLFDTIVQLKNTVGTLSKSLAESHNANRDVAAEHQGLLASNQALSENLSVETGWQSRCEALQQIATADQAEIERLSDLLKNANTTATDFADLLSQCNVKMAQLRDKGREANTLIEYFEEQRQSCEEGFQTWGAKATTWKGQRRAAGIRPGKAIIEDAVYEEGEARRVETPAATPDNRPKTHRSEHSC